ICSKEDEPERDRQERDDPRQQLAQTMWQSNRPATLRLLAESVEYQEGAVIEAKQNERPFGPVPETEDNHRKKQDEVRPGARTTGGSQRRVQVVTNPE